MTWCLTGPTETADNYQLVGVRDGVVTLVTLHSRSEANDLYRAIGACLLAEDCAPTEKDDCPCGHTLTAHAPDCTVPLIVDGLRVTCGCPGRPPCDDDCGPYAGTHQLGLPNGFCVCWCHEIAASAEYIGA